MNEVPYGAWPSPISAADVSRAGVRLSSPEVVGDEVWWCEGRPEEAGRTTIVRRATDGTITDVLPPPWNVRSRVHEYGGLAWQPVPVPGGHAVVFANLADQRLYRCDPGGQPYPLTPPPATPAGLRYADLVLTDDRVVWCVREAHHESGLRRHIVTVPLDGSAADDPTAVREVVSGSDFLTSPRPSPDGTRLAWIAWNHPQMPWDGSELRVATLTGTGTADAWSTVCGGVTESVFQPEWVDNDSLYVVSDRDGWWNLYQVDAGGGEPRPLCPRAEEFGEPGVALGGRAYVVVGNRLLVKHGTAVVRLGLLDPATGTLSDLDLPYTAWGSMAVEGNSLATVAGAPDQPPSIVRIDLDSGRVEPLRQALPDPPDPAYLAAPQPRTFADSEGRAIHALIHPPTNPDVTAPAGQPPPYVVNVHGGPTGQASTVLSMEYAYFTSRGIGVVDVNYGGSTGFGREYRELLRGQWGVVDVDDCVAVAQALVAEGTADGARLGIRGASSGGWTGLAALTRTDVFAAGVSVCGVTDARSLATDTHDFESRYLDGLVGPLPEYHHLYDERSPLSHVDGLSCPVLLMAGADDPVAPPSQSERFADALAGKGIPHAYLVFEGEQHGFRRTESQVRALEAELSFYGQVFDFDPPGVPILELVGG